MSVTNYTTQHCAACGRLTQHSALGKCLDCKVASDKAKVTARKEEKAAALAAKRAARQEQARLRKNAWHAERQKKKRAERRAAMSPEEIEAKKADGIAKMLAGAAVSREKQAQQELARRELARRHLLPFIMRFEKDYKAGWVHKDICERLERFSDDVIAGKSPRLMIFMPPRHGKSLIASQYFPAWHFGRAPQHEFISASYAQTLQLDFSRKIQELIRSPDYRILFPNLRITKGNEALERWSLSTDDGERTKGGFLAAGVGGPITGRGANVANIDDPVKNREEADSQVSRESTKNWFSSTLYTRLAPGGGLLIIQTRWHDDDLSGWQLEVMKAAEKQFAAEGEWPADAERWEVVSYPAIATHDEKYRRKGEALHPDRYALPALLKMKRTMIPRDWSALMQQSPVVEEGAYFEKRMFRFYEGPAHPDLNIFCAGDLAISKKESADYTVFTIAGLAEDDRVYFLDERRGRWDADEIVDQIIDIYRVWKPRRFGIEKGHILMALGPHLERRIREEKLYGLIIEELAPTNKSDKMLRGRPLQGRMARGQCYWPKEALWVDEHVNELLRFPTGVNDDRVDADAWICQMLANVSFQGSGRKKKDATWRSKLKGYVAGRHKTRPTMMAA